MIKLFTNIEYEKSESNNPLPLQCEYCKNTFYLKKHSIAYYLAKNKNAGRFCSKKCCHLSRSTNIVLFCKNCQKEFLRLECHAKLSKNHFCSKSCAAHYNNLHKTTGTRRSKLELWIGTKLSEKYPNYHIVFNSKETIGSELDIFIPKLKLAIELNGIYHYEPIHGQNKFEQIQNNDNRKIIACYEHDIELLSIDTSRMKNFKEHHAQEYLNIIINIIEQKQLLFGD